MKKLKGIVPVLLSCMFAFTFALAACSDDDETPTSSGSDSTEYAAMLSGITVSGAKTSFTLGEAFSTEGLVVKASTKVNFINQAAVEVTDYVVDSSEYDNTKEGTYTILVSYSLPDTYAEKYASYDVTVSSKLPEYCNISLEYSGSTSVDWVEGSVTLDITENNTLTVTQYVGEKSETVTETVLTDYDLYYSINGGEKTALTTTTITATEQGTYSIYAIATYTEGTESKQMEAFVNIQVGTVAETVTSVGLANSDITSTASYSAGDTITSNDLFTLVSTAGTTYGAASGTGSYTDVDNKEVTPSAGLKNSSAVEKSTSCDVFTITANAACTVSVYVTISNDSFNSQRAADVYYKLNGTQATAQSVTVRTTVVNITQSLSQGDTLVIGFTNGTSGTAKMYLWGALAPVTSVS
ncbi:MAG: bacterial Ig-like domain-containing protein [Clostridia bacterium]|nr:bacterial Ig-like domain-containing protein [Clostridia bacterium]